jgi:hypothetical protein
VTLRAFKNPCCPGWRIFSQPAVRKGLNIWQSQNADKVKTCKVLNKNMYITSHKIKLDWILIIPLTQYYLYIQKWSLELTDVTRSNFSVVRFFDLQMANEDNFQFRLLLLDASEKYYRTK